MPRKSKSAVQSVDRSKAAIGFKRARDLYDTAVEASNAGRWTALGYNAIMASIALADALLVHEKEIRSTGPNHLDVAELLLEACAHVEGIKEAVNHLRRILLQKNAVQYEMRVFIEKDARAMRRQMDRLFEWAFKHWPGTMEG